MQKLGKQTNKQTSKNKTTINKEKTNTIQNKQKTKKQKLRGLLKTSRS